MKLQQRIAEITTELRSLLKINARSDVNQIYSLTAERNRLARRKYRSSKLIEAHPGVDEVMICCGQVIVYIAEGWRADDRTSTIVGEKLADVALGVACIEQGEVE